MISSPAVTVSQMLPSVSSCAFPTLLLTSLLTSVCQIHRTKSAGMKGLQAFLPLSCLHSIPGPAMGSQNPRGRWC